MDSLIAVVVLLRRPAVMTLQMVVALLAGTAHHPKTALASSVNMTAALVVGLMEVNTSDRGTSVFRLLFLYFPLSFPYSMHQVSRIRGSVLG